MKMLILIWSEGLLIWAGLNEAGGEPKGWPAGGKPLPTIVEVAASGFPWHIPDTFLVANFSLASLEGDEALLNHYL